MDLVWVVLVATLAGCGSTANSWIPPAVAPAECGTVAGAPLEWAGMADPNVVGFRDLDHPSVPIYVTAEKHPLAPGHEALSRIACIAYPGDPVWTRIADEWRPPSD
jgi:hypothetical protein